MKVIDTRNGHGKRKYTKCPTEPFTQQHQKVEEEMDHLSCIKPTLQFHKQQLLAIIIIIIIIGYTIVLGHILYTTFCCVCWVYKFSVDPM